MTYHGLNSRSALLLASTDGPKLIIFNGTPSARDAPQSVRGQRNPFCCFVISDSRDVILPEKESRKKKFNDGVAASAGTF